MVDLFIKIKFAEASFDQDSMKKCLECYLCVNSFVVLFLIWDCVLDLLIKMKFVEASFDQDSMKNMYGMLLV
jgi:hypothetical protein